MSNYYNKYCKILKYYNKITKCQSTAILIAKYQRIAIISKNQRITILIAKYKNIAILLELPLFTSTNTRIFVEVINRRF